MICRNCKFSLQGSEKFCPNCGAPLCENPKVDKIGEVPAPEAPGIFFTPVKHQESEEKPEIFRTQDSQTEQAQERREKKPAHKSSSKAPVVLMLVLILLVLTVGLFFAVEHFDIAPAIMQYLDNGTSEQNKENTLVFAENSESDYEKDQGILEPDINYSPTAAYVAKINILSLRKGPSDSYGLLKSLEADSLVQIIGGTAVTEQWIYVYVPFYDCYGWVNASFVTLYSNLENSPDLPEETTHQTSAEETTAEPDTTQPDLQNIL